MSVNRRTLVDHTFHGSRFDDGGVDVDVVHDVARYKTLLVEVAKELWRRNNPDQERLPKNFEDSLSLKFYEVRSNCATLPLERALSVEEQERFWQREDELDGAVELVADTIAAAAVDLPLPERFPKNLLTLFQDYGKTLRGDEWIEHRPAGRQTSIRYDATVRERLKQRVEPTYEDFVDVTGEVTMARISNPRMAIQLPDGREIEAQFTPQDEQTITTALKDHAQVRLQVVGRGQFSVDGVLQRIVVVDHAQLVPVGPRAFDATVTPIWEEFAEALANVPAEELAKLPSDGAERLDEYVYGHLGRKR